VTGNCVHCGEEGVLDGSGECVNPLACRDRLADKIKELEAERDAALREVSDRTIECGRLEGKLEVQSLLRQIDEMRRLKEDEDTIAVSQQFDLERKGPWIVHGRNGNRQPKIAYFETQEQAEDCAAKVRRVIAEALAPYREDGNA